jgi:phenylalanyl-tRNA synthetase beta chain
MNFLTTIIEKLKGTNKISAQTFPGIVAAKVVDVNKHPNADRLRVVKLDVGDKVVEPVVCGAWNFEAGDIVALALPGATIPHNIHSETHESFVLGTAKLRGIESQGMICAEYELGIGPLSEKPEIMVLKPDTPIGSQFKPDMVK